MSNSITVATHGKSTEQQPLGERVLGTIHLEMTQRDISLDQLSTQTGIKPGTLAQKLSDQWAINMSDLYVIATALGQEVTDVIATAMSTNERW